MKIPKSAISTLLASGLTLFALSGHAGESGISYSFSSSDKLASPEASNQPLFDLEWDADISIEARPQDLRPKWRKAVSKNLSPPSAT